MSFDHRHAELQFKSGEETLYPVQFSIHERISQPWVARITARSEKADIALKHIVGFSGGLRATVGEKMKTWTGVIRNMEIVRAAGFSFQHSTYYLEIVPNFWLLTQRRGHRIFQHKTTEEIVTEILTEWGIFHQWNLRREHPTREYCVQYGESDFAFVSRLLEEDGIAYHFDDGHDQKRVTRLLLQEQPRRAGNVRLRYHDNVPDVHVGFWATKLHVGQASRSGNATYIDFDFRRPESELESAYKSEKSTDPEKSWERYIYSPGGFLIDNAPGGGDTPVADDKSVARHDQEKGNAIAKRTVEAMQFKRRFVEFETNMLSLNPGMHCVIDGNPTHPRADIHEQEMMIVESNTLGNATGEFVLLATAVFDKDPFIVPRTIAKPQIDGVQSAIVVGPEGEEIYTDEFGRVRVRFHWDREGKYDDNCTCWLRVNQGWAGPGYGAMNIPRIGHEVLVEFLDGDPDQPVIIGRMYNATSNYPYTLPSKKTHSAWKTQSSPYKDGYYNEIFIDDQVDKELIYLQAQRNMMKLVKNNETRRVGKERLDVVGEHRLGVVRNVDAYHVGEQHLVKMIKERNLKILDKEDPTFTPRDTWIELKDEKITLTTGKAAIILDGPNITIQADKGIRFSSDKDLKIKGKAVFLNCGFSAAKDTSSKKKVDDQVRKLDDDKDRTKVEILELLNKELEKKVLTRGWGFACRRYERKKPRDDSPGWFQRTFFKKAPTPDAEPDKSLDDFGDGSGGAGTEDKKWSTKGIVSELKKSPKAKASLSGLSSLPKKPKFIADPNLKKGVNGVFNPDTYEIRIRPGLSDAEAAPIIAHELLHAKQTAAGRPKDFADLLEMEVEAKNLGLDVYEDLEVANGKYPNTPSYDGQLAKRWMGQETYDQDVRDHYAERYAHRKKENGGDLD